MRPALALRPGRCWRWSWNRPGLPGCRWRCSSLLAATAFFVSQAPSPPTCAGSCPNMPRATASTLRHWPVCRCSPPGGLLPLELADAEHAALDRRVRACDRLTRAASEHKTRIKDLVRQLLPMTPLIEDIGVADLAVLERWADPRTLLKIGPSKLKSLIVKASHNHHGAERAEQWRSAAAAAVELYGNHPAIAWQDMAAEVVTEVRLLKAIQAQLAVHAARREEAYRWADHGQLARSLPGIAKVGGPVIAAAIGRAERFPTGAQFKSYAGLAPRASETGNTDRKGQPMSKAGSSLLRTTFFRAADTARKQDPQLAKIYYTQMVERGANHVKASCVVAAHLAERAWAVMARGMPYVVCDINGEPVTAEQAKTIIAKQWTVPPEVRARRRNTKTTKAGKAPQQVRAGQVQPSHEGAGNRGDLPHQRSSNTTPERVKELALKM